MSEQNFNGGGVATQEPPAEAPDAPDTGSRRNLVIVGIAVAVALLVAVWFLFLSGGGSSTPTGAVPACLGQGWRSRQDDGQEDDGKKTVVVKPAADKDTTGRDPFKALLKPAASPSASCARRRHRAQRLDVDPEQLCPGGQHPGQSERVVATVNLVSIDSKAKTATFNVATTGNPVKYPGIKVGETFATLLQGVRPRHQVRPGAVRRRHGLGLHGHPAGGPSRFLIVQHEHTSRPERLAPTSGDQPLVHGRIAACFVG